MLELTVDRVTTEVYFSCATKGFHSRFLEGGDERRPRLSRIGDIIQKLAGRMAVPYSSKGAFLLARVHLAASHQSTSSTRDSVSI